MAKGQRQRSRHRRLPLLVTGRTVVARSRLFRPAHAANDNPAPLGRRTQRLGAVAAVIAAAAALAIVV